MPVCRRIAAEVRLSQRGGKGLMGTYVGRVLIGRLCVGGHVKETWNAGLDGGFEDLIVHKEIDVVEAALLGTGNGDGRSQGGNHDVNSLQVRRLLAGVWMSILSAIPASFLSLCEERDSVWT